MRTRFARMLLFATQICHIVVIVEPSPSFDTSYLSIFKGLKIVREKYVLKFLPKLLKNTSAGSYLNKEVRLCSPRFLFFFEKLGRAIDINNLTAHEIDMEDSIYQMLRTNFIITNNAQLSLFSIPKNKKFLYVNTDDKLNSDPIADSLDLLLKYIDGSDDEFQYKPYRGYAIEYMKDENTIDFDDKDKSNFLMLLNEHVEEALNHGFDDSISKFRGKSHFVRPTVKLWFEMFKFMHKIFVENPGNGSFEAKDPDYVSTSVTNFQYQIFYIPCNLFRKLFWKTFTKFWTLMNSMLNIFVSFLLELILFIPLSVDCSTTHVSMAMSCLCPTIQNFSRITTRKATTRPSSMEPSKFSTNMPVDPMYRDWKKSSKTIVSRFG